MLFPTKTFRCRLRVPVGCVLLLCSLSASLAQGTHIIRPIPVGVKNPFSVGEITIEGKKWVTVKSNSVTLFGIPVEAGGFTRRERAYVVAYNRLSALQGRIDLSDRKNYRVIEMNSEITISLKNRINERDKWLILTIDRNFEKALGHRRRDIAYYWLDLMTSNLSGTSSTQRYERAQASPPEKFDEVKSSNSAGRRPSASSADASKSSSFAGKRAEMRMKKVQTQSDPAGRPLDKTKSWLQIPNGYSSRYQ